MKHLSIAALAALMLACLAGESQAGGCASAQRGRQFSQRTYNARNVGHSYGYAAKTVYSYAAQQAQQSYGYDAQAQQQQYQQQQAAPAYQPQAQSYQAPVETAVQQQIVITTVTRQQTVQTYAAPPAASGYSYGSRALKAPACHSYGCR
jgi:hypothetical protein